jgi:ABC-type multidrug transport system ATPase subunit
MVVMNKGEIIVEGTPKQTVQNIEGQIWQTAIDKEQLTHYKKQFKVISNHISEGKMIIRVVSNLQPSLEFACVDANLEDVYFSNIL